MPTSEVSPLVIGLLLAAAVIHATWNALVKGSEDRLASICVISLFGALATIPFLFVFEAPTKASWPFMFGSGALQVGYCLFLVRAYQLGDLAQVYPIARGSAPLLVTLGAFALAGEFPQGFGLIGIALVCLGIAMLASGVGRASPKAVLAALATGGFIASYMVVDGLGVRVAGSATGYAAWQALVGNGLVASVYLVIRRQPLPIPRTKRGAQTAVAGALGALGYCIAVWAMSGTGMGSVSALRETSIVFAALIGIVFLKERMTAQKWIGVATVTAGVISLSI